MSTPALLCPGNADDIENFRTIMRSDTKLHQSDTPTASFHRLEETLAQKTQPVVLAMHHLPMPIGIAELDIFRLQNSDILAQVIAKYPQIITILCGHTHTNTATLFAGVPVRIVSGLAFSNALCIIWNESEFPSIPGNPILFAFHIIKNGTITTQYEYMPN